MHPESLRIARHWLVTGLEKARDFITLQDDIDWLQSLTPEAFENFALRIHTLTPDPVSFVHIPKDDGVFRNVPILSVRDRLLLTALVVENYPAMIRSVTCMTTLGIDHQYPLPQNPQDANWVNEYKDQYHGFRDKTQALEDAGHAILNTDIKNFAGSCNHEYLTESLRCAGWSPQTVTTLGKFFNTWSAQGMTGVPQGMVITEILMKTYLSDIDRMMSQEPHVRYYRYSDDIRIAGRDLDQVREAQLHLEVLLRDAGLKLKPEKTFMSGIARNSGSAGFRLEDYYDPLLRAQGLTQGVEAMDTNLIPIVVLEDIYVMHLSPARVDPARPHQTLFNFTLNRLSKAGSQIAHPDLPQLVHEHPGKMLDLVRYALQTGYEGLQGIHDSLSEVPQRDYFKYATLLRLKERLQAGEAVSATTLRLAEDWSVADVPSFVASKAREVQVVAHRLPVVSVDLPLELSIQP